MLRFLFLGESRGVLPKCLQPAVDPGRSKTLTSFSSKRMTAAEKRASEPGFGMSATVLLNTVVVVSMFSLSQFLHSGTECPM